MRSYRDFRGIIRVKNQLYGKWPENKLILEQGKTEFALL